MDPASQELQLRRAGVPQFTSTETSASPAPPVLKSARDGTSSTAALPAATPWWWWPSIASDGPGKISYGPSANCGTGASRFVPWPKRRPSEPDTWRPPVSGSGASTAATGLPVPPGGSEETLPPYLPTARRRVRDHGYSLRVEGGASEPCGRINWLICGG